jgi:hypothetical protein
VAAVLALMPLDLAAAAAPQSPAVVRVFTMRFRRAEDALVLVRPLLTDAGSIILESKSNTLTIRDTAAAVERAAQAVAFYDVPPRSVEIAVTLLKASSDPKVKTGPGGVSEEIRGIGERLKKLYNFTDYARLDSIVVQGTEGEKVASVIGVDYHMEFFLDPSGDDRVMRLKSFALDRLRRDAAGHETRREILRTTLNMTVGQPLILGVGRDEAAAAALFLVFYPSWRVRGPGPGIF